jgi:hypothetical protein
MKALLIPLLTSLMAGMLLLVGAVESDHRKSVLKAARARAFGRKPTDAGL